MAEITTIGQSFTVNEVRNEIRYFYKYGKVTEKDGIDYYVDRRITELMGKDTNGLMKEFERLQESWKDGYTLAEKQVEMVLIEEVAAFRKIKLDGME